MICHSSAADFFPAVDAGEIRLHVRAPAGTRLENPKRFSAAWKTRIRHVIPAGEIGLVIDNMGRGSETFNFAFGDGATIRSADGEVLVALKEGNTVPARNMSGQLRSRLQREVSGLDLFLPTRRHRDADSQLRPAGTHRHPGPGLRSRPIRMRAEVHAEVARVPGAVDVHMHQVVKAPDLHFDIDRGRAANSA